MRDYREMVVSDPGVMMGKPVIAGTRITVELILEKLAAGETVEQLLEAHPRLNEDAVRAALAGWRTRRLRLRRSPAFQRFADRFRPSHPGTVAGAKHTRTKVCPRPAA
jgi:uncharacterized protein (DUF433 family)